MLRKTLIGALCVLGISLAADRSLRAITDGELDGNRHPYVGLMVAHR